MARHASIRNGEDTRSQLEDGALNENNATSISTFEFPVTVLVQALGEVQTVAVQIYPSHFKTNEGGDLQLMIYLQYEGLSVLHTMNKAERNVLIRNNPTLLAAWLSNAQRQMADQRGCRHLEDCSISWKPSLIPFHLAYTIIRSDLKCQHLASARNLRARNPISYAEVLIPLAKSFLAKPFGSWSPHLPFIWVPAHSSSPEILDPEDPRVQKTIEHCQLIVTQFETIENMDITTAEATARLINENRLIPGLLELIFDPGPKKLGPPPPENGKLEKIRSGAIHPRKPELDRSDFELIKREKSNSREAEQARNGYKNAGQDRLHIKKASSMIAKRRKSFGSIKADNSKGLIELSRAVPDGFATWGPRDIASNFPHRQHNKISPPRRAEAAAVRLAISRERGESSKTTSKMPHELRQPLHEKDGGPEKTGIQVPVSSIQSAQVSQFVISKDSEATKPPKEPVPPPPLKGSFQSFISELTLPCSAYLPQMVGSSKKRASEVELSDLTCDTVYKKDGTHCYPPEDKLLLARAMTPNNVPDSMGYSTGTTQSSSIIEGGVQGLGWAYANYTDVDEALLEAGVWLWERLQTYFYPHQVSIKMSDPYILAPVIVSHESSGKSFPLIEYSGETVHIIPHDKPWEDVRSMECHPDFLPPCKLVEYQACEAAGYYVWRHDRDQLPCRKPDCDTLVMDHNPFSVLCQGCGPKTIIRYCSFQHQIEDIGEHWMECGDPSLVMQCVIDHTTAPEYFFDKPPEIADRYGMYGLKCAELQRQKIYFMNNGGYYTLFDPITHDPRTLTWPETDPKCQEMDGRIERLLNIAFFGIRKRGTIRYIYRLLRELLCRTKEWTDQIQEILNTQIRSEFKYSGKLENCLGYAEDDAPCDCEWIGRDLLPQGHLSTCGEAGSSTTGLQLPTPGLQSWVERMENYYWILRAWRQQHPTEKDWRVRANGYGVIPLKPGEEIYQLGPGWTGWGGKEGNGRGSDWILDNELRKRFSIS